MENKVYFLGKSGDFALAEELYNLVCEQLSVNAEVAVLEKGAEEPQGFDSVVCEFGDKRDSSAKVFTYSIGQSNADVCGFNFQKREKSRSLDLFSQNFMGRVNLPLDSKFSEASVIYAVAGLVAAGCQLTQILKAINSKIS